MKTGIILISLLVTAPAAASAPAPNCAAFEAVIDGALKSQAITFANDIGDNSAPRATLSELRIANQWRKIEINLRLMEAAGCPLPTTPITGMEYLTPALTCENARLTAIRGGSTAEPSECNLDSWRKFGAAPASPAGSQ